MTNTTFLLNFLFIALKNSQRKLLQARLYQVNTICLVMPNLDQTCVQVQCCSETEFLFAFNF